MVIAVQFFKYVSGEERVF